MQPFKLVKFNCKNGLSKEEINQKGYGIAISKYIKNLEIQFDNKLNDCLSLENIEGMFRFSFEKIYISCPPQDEEFEILIMTNETAYFDMNVNFEKTSKMIDNINKNISSLIKRGNDYDFRELKPTIENEIFTRKSNTPPIIYIEIIGDTENWDLLTETKNQNRTTVKKYPIELLKNNALSLNFESILLKPQIGAKAIKVYVEYFIS